MSEQQKILQREFYELLGKYGDAAGVYDIGERGKPELYTKHPETGADMRITIAHAYQMLQIEQDIALGDVLQPSGALERIVKPECRTPRRKAS